MSKYGGGNYYGGTSSYGGKPSDEEKYYKALQGRLGDGVYTKSDSAVRSRFLMAIARGLAHMSNEARRSRNESVPCRAFSNLGEWERIHEVTFPENAVRTVKRRQAVQRALMRFKLATAHIIRIQEEVRKILEDDECYGYENTGTTMIGPDGIRYWCILVPDWMALPEFLPLYFMLKNLLRKIAPAHTVPALCTSDDGGSPPTPEFYLDGYRGSAVGKDAPGE